MKENEAIKEIRDTRRRISERFGHDPKRLVQHYMDLQKKRTVSKKSVNTTDSRRG